MQYTKSLFVQKNKPPCGFVAICGVKRPHKGIEEGSNCFGYHMWTPIDCWSWKNAYKNRYGFIAVDLATQKKTVKKSGYWMKRVIEQNGF